MWSPRHLENNVLIYPHDSCTLQGKFVSTNHTCTQISKEIRLSASTECLDLFLRCKFVEKLITSGENCKTLSVLSKYSTNKY